MGNSSRLLSELRLNVPDVSGDRRKELQIFEELSKLRFKSKELLNLAFCHRSYSNENKTNIDNNEKLEFLGDSVLGIVVTDYLFRAFPDKNEGELAKIKSLVVSEDSLAEIARIIRIDNYILIGKGEEYSGGRTKKALLADCFEALLGAYYLDSGFKKAGRFILEYLTPLIHDVDEDRHENKDYKTLLQEYVQKKFRSYPHYKLLKIQGPEHKKEFWIEVEINKKTYGPGKGTNKKKAEQDAARIAYTKLAPKKKK
jgi:ribonuclease-3